MLLTCTKLYRALLYIKPGISVWVKAAKPDGKTSQEKLSASPHFIS